MRDISSLSSSNLSLEREPSEKNVSMNQLFELQEAHFEIFQIFAIFFVKNPSAFRFQGKSDLKTLQLRHPPRRLA